MCLVDSVVNVVQLIFPICSSKFELSVPFQVNGSLFVTSHQFVSVINNWKLGLKFNSAQRGPCPVKYLMLSSLPDKKECLIAQRDPGLIPLRN